MNKGTIKDYQRKKSASHATKAQRKALFFSHPEGKPLVRIFKGGRNEPCPCGSGKKFKKCCLVKEEQKLIKK